MTELERKLYLEFADGDDRTLPILFEIHKYVYAPHFVAYLLRLNLKGALFIEWLEEQFSGNVNKMTKHITKKLQGEVNARP